MNGPRPLQALTLHRPWSILVAKGIKKIENRTWHPEPLVQPGEWFAIHAGKTYDTGCSPMAARLGVPMQTFFDAPSNSPGCIVAVVRYAGYTRASDDPWFFGPNYLGWLLDRAVEIDPVPCRGAQKLWRVPSEIANQVRAGYLRAVQLEREMRGEGPAGG